VDVSRRLKVRGGRKSHETSLFAWVTTSVPLSQQYRRFREENNFSLRTSDLIGRC
jgi:hypothetical protein